MVPNIPIVIDEEIEPGPSTYRFQKHVLHAQLLINKQQHEGVLHTKNTQLSQQSLTRIPFFQPENPKLTTQYFFPHNSTSHTPNLYTQHQEHLSSSYSPGYSSTPDSETMSNYPDSENSNSSNFMTPLYHNTQTIQIPPLSPQERTFPFNEKRQPYQQTHPVESHHFTGQTTASSFSPTRHYHTQNTCRFQSRMIPEASSHSPFSNYVPVPDIQTVTDLTKVIDSAIVQNMSPSIPFSQPHQTQQPIKPKTNEEIMYELANILENDMNPNMSHSQSYITPQNYQITPKTIHDPKMQSSTHNLYRTGSHKSAIIPSTSYNNNGNQHIGSKGNSYCEYEVPGTKLRQIPNTSTSSTFSQKLPNFIEPKKVYYIELKSDRESTTNSAGSRPQFSSNQTQVASCKPSKSSTYIPGPKSPKYAPSGIQEHQPNFKMNKPSSVVTQKSPDSPQILTPKLPKSPSKSPSTQFKHSAELLSKPKYGKLTGKPQIVSSPKPSSYENFQFHSSPSGTTLSTNSSNSKPFIAEASHQRQNISLNIQQPLSQVSLKIGGLQRSPYNQEFSSLQELQSHSASPRGRVTHLGYRLIDARNYRQSPNSPSNMSPQRPPKNISNKDSKRYTPY